MKRLRNLADTIQLKYPAKIVHNGQIVRDAFPYSNQLTKANVCGEFRYITQDELLKIPTSAQQCVPIMPSNSSVPFVSSGINKDCIIHPGLPGMPLFQIPLMPPQPPPPPPPLPNVFMHREQKVNIRTTMLQSNMSTSGGW